MKITLKRDIFGDTFTLGRLLINGTFFCYTCEDKVRPKKIKGITAIPTGTYDVALAWSNRFQKVLPLLANVPNYEGIRIHAGNTHEDTEGCILVGMGRTSVGVSASRDAMKVLMPILNEAISGGDNVKITVS